MYKMYKNLKYLLTFNFLLGEAENYSNIFKGNDISYTNEDVIYHIIIKTNYKGKHNNV